MKNIKLVDFFRIMRLNIRLFFNYWMKKNKKSPKDYPLDMPINAWMEQFSIWDEMGADK